ncbi:MULTISPECIES: hypothetical protein [Streptomyces]|uniref:hypothetical protein n=1 Tax=Streptomyces TaxID=1883 RepID=UPI0022706C17|nr:MULTISPECIES: hypothetical protein [unclassified Streptomyces]MCY0947107.1 hypothetical protein [Streptomyces sp. H34-AA3]MCY0953976.1 hypothetical protein [Streptomyces sp. H27-S2]MCZ4085318.1 hypothetical protein [Streptomyces sp. H34-S5]
MSNPTGDRVAIAALTELRGALAAHGITLPSLDLHLPSYAGSHPTPPLIALGSCNPATALRIASVLNRAPGR